jgi:predicted ArsR family transcriptional regulator
MSDEIIKTFEWIGELLKKPHVDCFKKDSVEDEIMNVLKEGWGNTETVELLKGLSEKYGDKAIPTVEKFLEFHVVKDWADIGKREAHKGTEIEDFIRVLWGSFTPDQGFQFTTNNEKGKTVFCVTKCPVYELAKKTGLYDWMYAFGCATDYLTTREFSPKMGFSRTKTLIQGHDCCDHTYYPTE